VTITKYLESVGSKIRQERERRELSQAQLGLLVGLSQAHVSRLEAGKARHVPIASVYRVAAALRVPIGEIIG
jgi:transcriptional regulator with XRE-family HTH domain